MNMSRSVRGRKNVHVLDSIYNIMIYQIAVVAIMGGIVFLATINEKVDDFVFSVTNISVMDKLEKWKREERFGYNYLVGIGKEELGMGGFNPLDSYSGQLPANCSRNPILISHPVAVPCYGIVSSDFDYRVNPITKTQEFHSGIDIATKDNSNIYTILSGRVIKVDYKEILGNYIIIDHGGGITSVYGHCSEIIAMENTIVKQGERIALVGSTGYSTGPHLHFEIRRNGISYNPSWIYSYTEL